MTDARLPERYLVDRRLTRLSPEHFRSFAFALIWSVSNRTDGQVTPEDLPLIPLFAKGAETALVACGLWTVQPDGWSMTDFAATQTSRHELEVLEAARRRDREKKARQRARDRASASVPGDGLGEVSLGTAQERTGQEGRQGREGDTPVNYNPPHFADPEASRSEPDDFWPVVAIPTSPEHPCTICGQPLMHPASIVTGICGKRDPEHDQARAAQETA
jgi:hypothetical protein